MFGQGYGAETITDFDQGDTPGTFNPSEGDHIEIKGSFNSPPTVTYVPDVVTIYDAGADFQAPATC